ncbi:MAG: cysteine hydrolase, partial [Deinococcus sp.]|nr:cysteine hydrolase [Deinococcus sp.]
CLYSLGLHLLTRSQHRGLGQRIVLPADCAQTWDAPDHPAELYHPLFLYQLARTGAEVVSGVRWPALAQ